MWDFSLLIWSEFYGHDFLAEFFFFGWRWVSGLHMKFYEPQIGSIRCTLDGQMDEKKRKQKKMKRTKSTKYTNTHTHTKLWTGFIWSCFCLLLQLNMRWAHDKSMQLFDTARDLSPMNGKSANSFLVIVAHCFHMHTHSVCCWICLH